MEIVELTCYAPEYNSGRKIPMFSMSVSAGVPMPVDDEIDQEIDLNEFLVEHPAATFFARVRGNSMKKSGISDGDILVVDSAVDPKNGKTVVVSINNELTVKIYREIDGNVYLESDDKRFIPVEIDSYFKFNILGTVTKVIHTL
jgi:DNA polymerase V